MNTSTSLGTAFGIALLLLACGGSPDVNVPGGDAPSPQRQDPGPPAPGDPTEPGRAEPAQPLPAPIVELPDDAEARRIMQAVAPEHLKELDRLFGRFLRGDASIYQGTFTARDNMGSLGSTYQDGVMTNANVHASIAWEDKIYWNGQHVAGWALSVRGPTHRIRIAQSATAPGTSALSLVAPDKSPWGLTGTCAGCVATLAPTTASTLRIANVVANGKWGNDKPLEVSADGSLVRLPSTQLTFETLVAVADPYRDGATMAAFVANGTEMVRSVSQSFREPTPIPTGKTFHSCEKIANYRLDWFVDKTVLARHGLRNLVIESTQTCCNEGPPGACMPRSCF